MEMAEKEMFNLTKFDGTNFALWKYGVSFLLDAQDLMEFVQGMDTQPKKETHLKKWKEWKKRQSKTAVILLSSVEQLHVNLINCDQPKSIWDKLLTLYGDTSDDAKQRCWKQFYDFQVIDGEPVATQIERFETCKKLSDVDDKPSDVAVMSKLLSSLSSRFSTFIMAWERTVKDERKKENLIARIIREDKRLKECIEDTSSLALQVKVLQSKFDGKAKSRNSDRNKKRKKSESKRIEENSSM